MTKEDSGVDIVDVVVYMIISILVTMMIVLYVAIPTTEEAYILIRGTYPSNASIIMLPSHDTQAFVKTGDRCYLAGVVSWISPWVTDTEVACP